LSAVVPLNPGRVPFRNKEVALMSDARADTDVSVDRPYFLRNGEGEKIVMFDQLFTLLVSGAENDGQYDSFVSEGNPGQAVPPHFHARTYETFFVLDGAVRLWLDDRNGFRETRILEPGDFAFVPKNTIHSYRIEKSARLTGITTAGFFDFFRAVGGRTEKAGLPQPPDFHIPPFELMGREGARHDVNFVQGYELFD
jgi:quercetin 2,3-dioxygenase